MTSEYIRNKREKSMKMFIQYHFMFIIKSSFSPIIEKNDEIWLI